MTGNENNLPGGQVTRRGLLRWITGASVAAAAPTLLLAGGEAKAAAMGISERRLALHNINTGEVFKDVYWRNGVYLPDALKRLNVVLRDHHSGQVTKMDPHLFDAMWDVCRGLDSDEPYKVICGFRSRKTNAAARRRSRGVARDSYHTHGKAVDVVLEGRTLSDLAQEARGLHTGGVGLYSRSGFVHMDVGPVRTW